jgi:hypothetical protein
VLVRAFALVDSVLAEAIWSARRWPRARASWVRSCLFELLAMLR